MTDGLIILGLGIGIVLFAQYPVLSLVFVLLLFLGLVVSLGYVVYMHYFAKRSYAKDPDFFHAIE